MRRHPILGIMLTAILAGCAAQGARTVAIDSASHGGDRVSLRTGDTLLVRLRSTPGTGYSWAQAEPAPGELTLIDSTFTGPEGTVVGAPGVQQFRFVAARVGSGTLRLVYRRVWETGVEPADSINISFRVEPR